MRQILSILFFAAMMPLAAFSQTTTGSLKGTIQNGKGELLKSVTVKLVNTKFTTLTDEEGNFSFGNIPAAKYTVSTSSVGFTASSKEVEVVS